MKYRKTEWFACVVMLIGLSFGIWSLVRGGSNITREWRDRAQSTRTLADAADRGEEAQKPTGIAGPSDVDRIVRGASDSLYADIGIWIFLVGLAVFVIAQRRTAYEELPSA